MSSDSAVQPHGAGWGWNNDVLGREGSGDGPSGSGRPSNSWGGRGGNTSYGSTCSGAQRSGSDTGNHGQAHNEQGSHGAGQCTSWGGPRCSSVTTGWTQQASQSSSVTGQAQSGVEGSNLATRQGQIGVQTKSTSDHVQYQEGCWSGISQWGVHWAANRNNRAKKVTLLIKSFHNNLFFLSES